MMNAPTTSPKWIMPPPSKETRKTKPRPKGIRGSLLRLGVRLPVIIILLLALAFLISTYLSVKATQNALIETLTNELNAQAASKAELIRSNLIWTRSVAIDLAAAAEVEKYDEATQLSAIQNTLKHNEQIFGSTIAYEPNQFQTDIYYWSPYYSRASDGSLKFTQLGNPTYNYFKWDWYTLPKQKGTPVLSPPYFDDGGGNIWMVTWSAPFFDPKTKAFKGVATADIAFSQTQKIVSDIAVGQNGYAFLLDQKGTILGIGDKGGFYQTMETSMLTVAQESKITAWENLVNAMITNKSGFVSATDAQGRPMFVAYTPVGLDTGWSLGLAFPQTEILEKSSRIQNSLIVYTSLIAIFFGFIIYLFTLSITQPLRRLTLHAGKLSTENLHLVEGRLIEPIQIHTKDELEDLAEAFNQMAANVAFAFETLEEKVTDRTRDLERNTLELATIAEVARDITIIRDLDTLLNVSVNLIRERFNYYHVGIFLIDNRGEYALLRAASSVAAQEMLDQNYKLKVGQEGLVGSVTRTGQAHIALDVGADAAHFQNPYLPDTRSEVALPLRTHSITIGALDIQSNVQSAFAERDVKILQLLADQLTAAIENAQLADQVKGTLAQMNGVSRLQTRQSWQIETKQRERPAYEYDGLQVRAIPPRLPEDLLKQLENGKPIIVKEKNINQGERGEKKTLMVPLRILNQVIGVIGLEQEDPNHVWSDEEIALVEAAANRAALTLENARLLEESQRRAAKERAIFEATAHIGSALNIENILHTTAEEIERVLSGAEITLQFMNDKKS